MSDDPSAVGEEAFEALQGLLIGTQESREATMSTIAALACGIHDGCDLVSITMIDRERPHTAAATDPDAIALDNVQYKSGTGPCLEAMREGRIVRVATLSDDTRFPGVAAAAVELGIASSLSTPLVVDGAVVGGLNYYSRTTNGFGAIDEALSAAFAAQAAVVASNARDYWAVAETSKQLQHALASRAVIEQAKGILMGVQHCTPDEAFDILRRSSQRENRKLREIAEELVQRTVERRGQLHA